MKKRGVLESWLLKLIIFVVFILIVVLIIQGFAKGGEEIAVNATKTFF